MIWAAKLLSVFLVSGGVAGVLGLTIDHNDWSVVAAAFALAAGAYLMGALP